MKRFDYHVHSTLSDGKCTPEELIREAIRRGFTKIGISDHSRVPFDPYFGIDYDRFASYQSVIDGLKQKYAGSITVLCGLEQDYFSPLPCGKPDYLIGSVHYICEKGTCFAVDDKPEVVLESIRTLFDGDVYAYAEAYYAQMELLLSRTGADIIGHFDLAARYAQLLPGFDPNHPRYENAWRKAADALLPYGKPFEINTSGLDKTYREKQFPDDPILRYLSAHGGTFVLSSDSHRKETLGNHFEEFEEQYHDQLCDPLA